MILAGRRINDNMAIYVAERVAQLMIQQAHPREGLAHPVMGLTFKENCPDLRNTKVVDVVRGAAEVRRQGRRVRSVGRRGGVRARVRHQADPQAGEGRYDAIVLAVAHKQFREMGIDEIRAFAQEAARAVRHQVCVRGRRGRWPAVGSSGGAQALACAARFEENPNCVSSPLSSAADFGDVFASVSRRRRSVVAGEPRSDTAFRVRPAKPRDMCRQLDEFPAAAVARRLRRCCLRSTPRRVAVDLQTEASRPWAVAESRRRLCTPERSISATTIRSL